MADLSSLIRLRRHTVEEKQKIVAELFRQVEIIEQRKQELLNRLQHEREALEKLQENEKFEAMEYFGKFAEVIRRNVERLEGEIAKMEVRIQIAQDDMREAFAELKRVEIVQRNRAKREKAELDKREAQEIDEMGIEGYRRKETSD